MTPEGQLKAECRPWAEERGWLRVSVIRAHKNGFPDDLYVREGEYIWVEFKTSDGIVSEQQKLRHKELREHHGVVFVVDNFGYFRKLMM